MRDETQTPNGGEAAVVAGGAPAQTGGAPAVAGDSGGAEATAGTANVDGSSGGSGGDSATGGAGGMGGSPDAQAGQTAGGGAGDASGGGMDDPGVPDERPWFSFFTTSMDGLFRLKYGDDVPADIEEAGFGGDLGGLEGADQICTQLAQAGNPGDRKTWRAFLSTAAGGPGEAVDAIDRIGSGPWYDWNNRLFAESIDDLINTDDGRPRGIDPQLSEMFTDENGSPVKLADEDNHDMLTGSDKQGRVAGGPEETCQNWTFAGTFDGDRDISIGHAWPRSENNGREWIAEHTVRGCLPGANLFGRGGAEMGDYRVGAGGGYGGFYCFALAE